MTDRHNTITVNLDATSRSAVIAAACALLNKSGARAGELGEWRARAAKWDELELLHRAAECGVRYCRSNQPYTLPSSK